MDDLPQVGRVLHYVLDNGAGIHCRPAMVVEDFPHSAQKGYVNLRVQTDGANDFPQGDRPLLWKTAVKPDHDHKTPGTWHWPRECSKTEETKRRA